MSRFTELFGKFLYIVILLSSFFWLEYSPAEDYPKSLNKVKIQFFWRPGCQNCKRAEIFLEKLAQAHEEIEVERFDVLNDVNAAKRLRDLAVTHGYDFVGVPAFYIEQHLIIGFRDEETTGREIYSLLERIFQGTWIEETVRDSVDLPLIGEFRVSKFGLPIFTIVLGLVDGFNPCAMWVLIFLLTLLVNLKSRSRMALISGVFVFVSGFVYFVFMAAWLNFFIVLGLTRVLQTILGVFAIIIGSIHIKDFFALKKGVSLSIPESAKTRIYNAVNRILRAENLAGALVTVITLAAMVNIVELACTAGLPVMYTQILASQSLSNTEHYAYLLLYNVSYMFDDSVMIFIAIITLSRKRLQEKGGRIMKLVSGLVISFLGLVFLFAPQWFSLS